MLHPKFDDFINAIHNNELSNVQNILTEFDGSVEAKESFVNSQNHQALYAAIEVGNVEIVKLLLDNGASIEKTDSIEDLDAYAYESTPIISAVEAGNIKIVEALLTRGANPNEARHRDRSHTTPLEEALKIENTEIVKLLINNGAEVKDALSYSNEESTNIILGLYPNILQEQGISIFDIFNNEIAVKIILEKMGTEGVKATGDFPSFLSNHGTEEIFKLFIKIFKEDKEFIKIAIEKGYLDAVKSLEVQGADLKRIISDNKSYFQAALNKATEINKYLQEQKIIEIPVVIKAVGSSVASTKIQDPVLDSKGNTSDAVLKKALQDITYALNNNKTPDVGKYRDVTNSVGYNLLLNAVNEGNIKVVTYLLKNGFDVNKESDQGKTSLMIASIRGHIEISRLLMSYEANVKAAHKVSGNTALIYAVQSGAAGIALELMSRGNVNYLNNKRESALRIAIDKKYMNIVKSLIYAGADYDIGEIKDDAIAAEFNKIIRDYKQTNVFDDYDKDMTMTRAPEAETIKEEAIEKPSIAEQFKVFKELQNDHVELSNYIKKYDLNVNEVVNAKGDSILYLLLKDPKTKDPKTDIKQIEFLIKHGADVNLVSNGWTPLMTASRAGNIEAVSLLLDQGAEIDAISHAKNGEWTAIASAARHGHLNVVKLLFSRGADIDKNFDTKHVPFLMALVYGHDEIAKFFIDNGQGVGADGWTPLMYAVHHKRIEVVSYLINAEVDINHKSNNGYNALRIALDKNFLEIFKILLGNGAYINEGNDTGETPLILAIRLDHKEIALELIRVGADVNAMDNGKTSPLILAAMKGYEEIALELIRAGAYVNAIDNGKTSPLIEAIRQGYKTIAIELVNADADINQVSGTGNSALMLAARRGFPEVVSVLLEKGAKLDIINIEGKTAYDLAKTEEIKALIKEREEINKVFDAIDQEDPNALIELTSRGIDFNKIYKNGKTPLGYAELLGKEAIAEFLIKTVGIDANAINKPEKIVDEVSKVESKVNEITPNNSLKSEGPEDSYFDAARKGKLEVVKNYINNHKVDINEVDENGCTALIYAISKGNAEMVDFLLGKGAGANIANSLNGDTPLIYAVKFKNNEIIKKLINAKTDVNQDNNEGFTPLFFTTPTNNREAFEILIKAGADIDAVNKDGFTFLMATVEDGNPEWVKILLAAGADINKLNNEGKNAKTVALERGNPGIAGLIQQHENNLRYLKIQESSQNEDSVNEDINRRLESAETNEGKMKILLNILKENQQDLFLELLQKYNLDINTAVKDFTGSTILTSLLLEGSKYINQIEFLLNNGADVNISDKTGSTPLRYAFAQGDKQIISMIIDKGGDINEVVNDFTILMEAINSTNIDMINFLLSKGADVNVVGQYGWTALMYAALRGNEEIIQILINNGANLDEVNQDGNKAADLAQDAKIAKLLTENATPAEIVQEESKVEGVKNIEGVITKLGGVSISENKENDGLIIESDISKNDIAMVKAAKDNGLGMLQYYIEHMGVNVDAVDESGFTALMRAVSNGNEDMVQYLLEKNANALVKNGNYAAYDMTDNQFIRALIESSFKADNQEYKIDDVNDDQFSDDDNGLKTIDGVEEDMSFEDDRTQLPQYDKKGMNVVIDSSVVISKGNDEEEKNPIDGSYVFESVVINEVNGNPNVPLVIDIDPMDVSRISVDYINEDNNEISDETTVYHPTGAPSSAPTGAPTGMPVAAPKGNVILSIDASTDYEYVVKQDEAFKNFANNVLRAITESVDASEATKVNKDLPSADNMFAFSNNAEQKSNAFIESSSPAAEGKWYDFGGLHSYIYNGGMAFKGVDTLIDGARLALKPSIEHGRVFLNDALNVYTAFYGLVPTSGLLILSNFLQNLDAKGPLEAIKGAAETVGFMAVPFAISQANSPALKIAYSATMVGATGYGALKNGNAFYNEFLKPEEYVKLVFGGKEISACVFEGEGQYSCSEKLEHSNNLVVKNYDNCAKFLGSDIVYYCTNNTHFVGDAIKDLYNDA